MLCDWCDEVVVTETGDFETVFVERQDGGYDELTFHDYCYDDGVGGRTVVEMDFGRVIVRTLEE